MVPRGTMRNVNGILILYEHPPEANAPTIMEHVDAFERHSRFNVWTVNTSRGFPSRLRRLDFTAIVLHYSLFGVFPFMLDDEFESYLARSTAYKVAFFQDEYQFCRSRFGFIDRFGIDCVYTLLEPAYWGEVYARHTSVRKLVHTIPGYVSDELVALAARMTKPDDEREIDVGYRTRTLPVHYGKGGREKAELGRRFLEAASGTGLKLDIGVDEASRIYGEAWFEFLASCRAVLGVEAGVSIFDVDDAVREERQRLHAVDPSAEPSEEFLDRWENNIYYRTISPRHFEAAALHVCQILFEGKYSGVLEPMVHYLPLQKDFSNLDDVIRWFRDGALRRTLTENAYRDLIASDAYSYERFVAIFDEELIAAGLRPEKRSSVAVAVGADLARGRRRREAVRLVRALPTRQFRGRRQLAWVLRPLLGRLREVRRRTKLRRRERSLAADADS